jgi:hypothetical protein
MVPCLRIPLVYYRMLRAYQGLLREPLLLCGPMWNVAPFLLLAALRAQKLCPVQMIDIARNVVSRITSCYSPNMSSENPTYTVLVARSSYAGNFRSRQPLLDGARYWIRTSADPAATIITAWSSGNGEWVLRATVGHAAKLTVKDNSRGTPTFQGYKPWPQGSLNWVASA